MTYMETVWVSVKLFLIFGYDDAPVYYDQDCYTDFQHWQAEKRNR